MRTVVLGKNIENSYEIKNNQELYKDEKIGEEKIVFTDKPSMVKNSEISNWSEICSFDGKPRYNSSSFIYSVWGNNKYINISEEEEVSIDKEIFRADLNELQLRTNKVISETDTNKEDCEKDLENITKLFNKEMIESNEQLKAYCDLHKLTYENTDCIELFKLVFPNKTYLIEHGVMKVDGEDIIVYDENLVLNPSLYSLGVIGICPNK